MAIKQMGNSAYGWLECNDEEPGIFRIVTIIPITNDPNRSEHEEHWAIPVNNNARWITGCLPYGTLSPKSQAILGEKYGFHLSGDIEDQNLSPLDLVRKNQEKLAELLFGDDEESNEKNFEIQFSNPIIVDERIPIGKSQEAE